MNRPRLGILLKSGGPRSGPGRYVRALADAAARDGFEVVEFRQSHGEPPTGPSRLVTLERSAPACREEMRPRPTWVRRWARGVTPFAVRYSLGFSRETRRLSDVLGAAGNGRAPAGARARGAAGPRPGRRLWGVGRPLVSVGSGPGKG